MKNVKFNVKGMHCEGCSNRLERILNSIEGVKSAKVSLEEKIANIDFDENLITEKDIKDEIIDAGFEA